EHRVAIRIRHHQVEQHERGLVALEPGDRFTTTAQRDRGQSGRSQSLAEHVTADRIVIHDQDEAVVETGRDRCIGHRRVLLAGTYLAGIARKRARRELFETLPELCLAFPGRFLEWYARKSR